jgi:bifunctional enzyme CysN/CysC
MTQPLVRIVTAGSVDDGKSTLLGRLLYEANAVFDDYLGSIQGEDGVDLAFITDGLRSEREQGITIDVAYKYFTTKDRKYVLADSPGHVQYTRNMVTAASLADIAIVLVDARKGILEQTRRHSHILTLMGTPNIILAINKIDLIDYNKKQIDQIDKEFRKLDWGTQTIRTIPLCALDGGNVIQPTDKTPWYAGPTLLETLDSICVLKTNPSSPYIPIQLVQKGDDGRLALGTLRGNLSVGDQVRVYPTKQISRIKALYQTGVRVDQAANSSVSVTLDEETDLSRGYFLANPNWSVNKVRKLKAKLVWFDEDPCKDKMYLIRSGVQETFVNINDIKEVLNFNSSDNKLLEMNSIASVYVVLTKPLYFTTYQESKELGSFILVDPQTNKTVAAGFTTKPEGSKRTRPSTLLLKSISYRVLSSTITASLAYLLTGNLEAALTLGVIETVGKIALFYAHERAWLRLHR